MEPSKSIITIHPVILFSIRAFFWKGALHSGNINLTKSKIIGFKIK